MLDAALATRPNPLPFLDAELDQAIGKPFTALFTSPKEGLEDGSWQLHGSQIVD